jgi:O-antigen ligase
MQYWFRWDAAALLRSLPPFEALAQSGISTRGSLNRVAGTAAHPIELGVVSAMLLPLAVVIAWLEHERSRLSRYLPILLMGLAIPFAISRAGVLALAVCTVVLLILLPNRERLRLLAMLPVGLVIVFMVAPGILRTFTVFFGLGTADPSITGRTRDFDTVADMITASLWLGYGPGGYPLNEWLDNQYFVTVLDLGLIGLAGLLLYLVVPILAAMNALRNSPAIETRMIACSLIGALAAAVVCFGTFDAFAFPMMGWVLALLVGFCGAIASIGRAEATARQVD